MPYDTLIRGGHIVGEDKVFKADIAIHDEKIAHIQEEILEPYKREINAQGMHIFPALIDCHVHFNEPGRSEWEGIATGSAALAAGGGSCFFDMPLNSKPSLLSKKDFILKKQAALGSSFTDFALWGGLTPDNLEHLDELAECGVIGFKAFMCHSGIEDFKAVDDLSLYQGMVRIAQLGLPLALHAESEALNQQLLQLQTKPTTIRDYLNTRPVLLELEAVNRAILFAQETGCELHFVHLSSARAIHLVTEAKMKGLKLSCETCPHYLHFNEEDLESLGTLAKCAPPLRNEDERQALWQSLLRGEVDIVASDHSPSLASLKAKASFFEAWGGISGVQSSLSVLLQHRTEQGLSLEAIAALCATRPAHRFNLYSKGQIELGFDADLAIVDLSQCYTLNAQDLFYKQATSPYVGQVLRGKVMHTLLRGHSSFIDGKHTKPLGQFLRPKGFA